MSSRAAIAACLDAGDHRRAWVEMTALAGHEPTTADCHVVAQALARLDAGSAGLTEVRVAVLASVTAEPLLPVLAGRGVSSHLAIHTYSAPFDQWTQEALDAESGLFRFNPDVVVIAIRLEDVAPALATGFLDHPVTAIDGAIERAVERVAMVLRGVRSRSQANVLLHAMTPPAVPALGMVDAFVSNGQRPAVRKLNDRLARVCADAGDVYLIDVERLIACVGVPRWHDARMAALAGLPYTPAAIHALVGEYLRYIRAFTGRVRKVLVTDLDETLWGGVVGEVGVDRVRLGPDAAGAPYLDLQRALLDLHRRGVLLAIDSKNNAEDALAVLDGRAEMLLRRDHFAAIRINWNDKADNLVDIAQELGLGLDSFVYIDDSAAECERVRAACPDVLAVPLAADVATRADTIRGLGVFDRLTHTDEDRQRGARYRVDAERRGSCATAQSIEEFYASLNMELFVEPVSASTLERAAELTSRTNQFTLTTRRFTPDALSAHLANDRRRAFVFRLTDRFGDHGWIGLAVAEQRGDLVDVTDFMVSCRVLKRTVETAMLAVVLEWAAARGARAVQGSFVATTRNRQTTAFYADHGFAPVDSVAELPDVKRFERQVVSALAAPAWIRIHRPAAVTR